MTLTEYRTAVSEALAAVDRICERTSLERSDLILVMTPDAHAAIWYYDDGQLMLDHEGYGCYCGVQIGIINERIPDTMITPAIIGAQYYHNGMALDDIIVVGDDNHLFQMRDTNPVRFVDTGYTVSFDAAVMEQMSDRMENAAADVRDMFAITPAGITITMDDVQINEQLLARLAGIDVLNLHRKKRRKACNTEDLTPGDTKALDEFINGFTIKQTLQQA